MFSLSLCQVTAAQVANNDFHRSYFLHVDGTLASTADFTLDVQAA
jgi:hypothetical protein